jgi:3-methyladenine DNA glycosylase AlkD
VARSSHAGAGSRATRLPFAALTELDDLRRELKTAAEPERVPVLQRFFKTGTGEYGEGDVFIGLRLSAANAAAQRFADLELDDVAELLGSPAHEERLVALLLLVGRYERGDAAERRRVFDLYMASTDRVNSWDLVDASAPKIVGAHLLDRSRKRLDRLAQSRSLWERRIAVVATLTFIKRGEYDDTLRIVRELLGDSQDLIHKACGWMLREVGELDESLLVAFIERFAADMPRTMLRAAIERLGPEERARLMSLR